MSDVFDLNSLLGPAPATLVVSQPDPGAEHLRLLLAVRGWTHPRALIGTADPAEQDRLLEMLAADVETAIETRPGLWYLSASVRRRVLGQAAHQALTAAVQPLSETDRDDPLRQAFAAWLVPPLPALSTLADPVLAMLGLVCGWLSETLPADITLTAIEAEQAARTLGNDLARMTRYPLVGAAHRKALGELADFARQPGNGGVSAVYVYGGGGSGKTTVLAFLQQQLQAAAGAVARIDFDEPTIDPARMATLNLELFVQLTRTVPGLADRGAFILDNLRMIGQAQRSSTIGEKARHKALVKARRPAIKRSHNVSSETWATQADSRQSSIIYGTLLPDLLGGPLVLILDTAELILTHSDRAAAGVAAWLDFLEREAGAGDIRLIIAGRDPPPDDAAGSAGFAAQDLLQRLAQRGVPMTAVIALPELIPTEAAELLRNCGVTDTRIADAAAAAVPGNPLLLRITADALLSGDAELQQAVQHAHNAAAIDVASARNYLMRRVVAHVPDPEARPYVLAAMFSPVVTAKLLEEAIIPAVDRIEPRVGGTGESASRASKLADRVFRALAAAQWLTRPSLDARTLSFNRDLRSFVLRLLRSGVAAAAFERDVRQSAAIHHLRRRGTQHRALALYQLAVLGLPYTRPQGVNRARCRELLRDVANELPGELRAWLDPPPQGPSAKSTVTPTAPDRTMSDEEWKLYLEGTSGEDGEGMALVRDDKAEQALDLYRSRPTRAQGMAPPFVVRALADLGQWDDPAANVEAVLDHEAQRWMISERYVPEDWSQIYWITRLALQRNQGRLAPAHVELLRHAAKAAKGPELDTLPGLIVIAEATLGQPIMDRRLRSIALKDGHEARIMLGVAQGDYRIGKVGIDARQIVVVQSDWARTFARNKAFGSQFLASAADQVQQRVNDMAGMPLAQASQLIDSIDKVATFDTSGFEPADLTLLFRGRTPEFYRPLRAALLTVCGDGVVGELTRAIIDPVLANLSIRPAEMQEAEFYSRLAGNPRAWAAALVSFADQARVLPLLAKGLAARARDENARMIAQSFLAWDRALCRGGSSLWPSVPPSALVNRKDPL